MHEGDQPDVGLLYPLSGIAKCLDCPEIAAANHVGCLCCALHVGERT
jgi:hypothetical protein